ncbi:TonB-dependent copper receptor [Vibrio sp. 404]|uniref:TonB-dependent copper receptor n=2 Tax=Vibrio marinisediminis TaxID=2758441 RepID=A0A7W2FNQ5_9VIBR|nr:TonB-dependent copper receptor [Vibrio marinisediminis]
MNKNKITSALFLPALIWMPSTMASECAGEKCNEHMIVMADLAEDGLITITDPKLPRQPLPSFDGSGYLKTIPGFSVTRKGGAGGDISLRGLAGSRISIINDGQQLAGTCGGRMDPPTNYISPETYDQVTVIKGPQTVRYGPMGSAGTVLFERDHIGFTQPSVEGRASITAGSFGRQDYLSELKAGNEDYYWSLDINGSKSDNFEDGGGQEIQSRYDRQNINTAVGFTPSSDSLIEVSYGRSSGEAEYADRLNKARTIDNENWSLIAEKEFDYQVLRELKFQGYWNENDHIMDQFDRPIDISAPLPFGANPRRTTFGGYVWAELDLSNDSTALVGIDHINQVQDMRGGTSLDQLLAASYQDIFSQQNWGLFVELENAFTQGTLYSGLRYDNWQTELMGSWASSSKENQRDDDFFSGFVRYEHQVGAHQLYAGVGHSERIPDYWETMKAGKMLTLDSEKTDQLDIGWSYSSFATLSASLFYAKLSDYILIDTQSMPNARNIDATLYGGEASIEYALTQRLSTTATVAYSHGDNDTDNVPLGQVSPLEGRLMVNYEYNNWSFGSLWRIVAKQDRVAIGQGNIVGQDLGENAGFGILSLNGAYQYDDQLQLSFGIDNLFDKEYSEHISKIGSGNDALPIEDRTMKVNEPGRTLWAKLDFQF